MLSDFVMLALPAVTSSPDSAFGDKRYPITCNKTIRTVMACRKMEKPGKSGQINRIDAGLAA
jgi:hypothetical protein